MLGGGRWSWEVVEMNWVEVDGAGWRWVHGLVIPLLKKWYSTEILQRQRVYDKSIRKTFDLLKPKSYIRRLEV